MKPSTALTATRRALALALAVAALALGDTMAAHAGLTPFALLGASPALADDNDDDRGGDDRDDDDRRGGDDDDDDDDNDDNDRIRSYRDREVLLLDPSADVLARARARGFRIIETYETRAIGLRVARLAVPRGWSVERARRELNRIAPDRAELHHLYRPLQGERCTRRSCPPWQQINWPKDTRSCGLNAKIGIVDTTVETAHPALRGAKIVTRRFAAAPGRPDGHGTAIAALIVGVPTSDLAGLMPNAELFAADPFANDTRTGLMADAIGVVRALDWLAASGVRVVGLSFGGPPNAVLRRAVERLADQGMIVIAAAGNGGPHARPVYPAAYQGVIAATAVDTRGRVYARANRGAYVDVAAPGVGLWTADRNGKATTRSGTSLAVPFVAAVALEHMSLRQPLNPKLALGFPTVDLGPAGRDDIYGHGLVVHRGACGG